MSYTINKLSQQWGELWCFKNLEWWEELENYFKVISIQKNWLETNHSSIPTPALKKADLKSLHFATEEIFDLRETFILHI